MFLLLLVVVVMLLLATFASEDSVVVGPELIASKAPDIFKASSGFEGGGN